MGTDGQPALQALFEPLQVYAIGPGGRFQVTTDRWGPYQLVLPPGEFQVWVERGGRPVAGQQTISVEHSAEKRLMLVFEYKD